jgi:quercetin dioxygenase-like cupin family protein
MTENALPQKGIAFIPQNLVNYQDGSVVSRMITYTPQGTVTVFAFAAGSGLSEHTAPYDALIQILEGSAEITLDGTTTIVQTGEYIILPASVPHAVHARVEFKMLLTMIHA